jgi:hypothetical protein
MERDPVHPSGNQIKFHMDNWGSWVIPDLPNKTKTFQSTTLPGKTCIASKP